MKTAHAHHPVHHSRNHNRDGDSALSHDIEGIKDGVAHLRTDVAELVDSAVHAGKSGVAAVQDMTGKAVDGITGAISDGVNGLTKTSRSTVKSVKRQIAEYPVTSTLIAVGAGYVVAKFLRRRMKAA